MLRKQAGAFTSAWLVLWVGAFPGGAPRVAAQPAPSFLSTCENLRESLSGLQLEAEELVTISVQGAARIAAQDEALAYISVCSPPHPHVLCVTYQLNGRKAGDPVVVTGALNVVDDAHIMLDPCLASSPERSSGGR